MPECSPRLFSDEPICMKIPLAVLNWTLNNVNFLLAKALHRLESLMGQNGPSKNIFMPTSKENCCAEAGAVCADRADPWLAPWLDPDLCWCWRRPEAARQVTGLYPCCIILVRMQSSQSKLFYLSLPQVVVCLVVGAKTLKKISKRVPFFLATKHTASLGWVNTFNVD